MISRVSWKPAGRHTIGLGCRISLPYPLAPAWGGLRELTFTLPPLALVAGLAETFVRLGCVLADGIYVAVICALRALIHVRSSCGGGESAGEACWEDI